MSKRPIIGQKEIVRWTAFRVIIFRLVCVIESIVGMLERRYKYHHSRSGLQAAKKAKVDLNQF